MSLRLLGYVTSNDVTSGSLIDITGPAQSAFGELSTATNVPIIQSGFPYNYISVIEYEQNTTGSGTINVVDGKAQLNVTSGTDTAELINRKYVRYANGQGLLIRFTCYFDNFGAGTEGYVGFFDVDDGFMINYNNVDGLTVIRRFMGTNFKTAQNDFSEDRLDGSGPSEMIYDPTLGNVFQIGLQWLGFGQICFCIENPETGGFITFHRIKYANSSQNTSIRNPSLRFTALIESSGNAGTIAIPSISVFNQGPRILNGPSFGVKNTLNISGASDPVLAIRNLTTVNGLNNRTAISIKTISLGYADTGNCTVELIGNPTITATWQDVQTNESVVEFSDNISSYSAGRSIAFFTLTDYQTQILRFGDYENMIQPGQTLLIVFTSTGGSGDALASISWREDK